MSKPGLPSNEIDDRYHVTHDAMTGLLNRRGLDERLDYLIDRYPGGFAVLMIDLDDVKRTNDLEGHDMGDSLIKQAADAIGEVTRQEDVDPGDDRELDTLALGRLSEAARTGGDEFILPLPGVDDLEKLVIVRERVDERLAKAGINASIGGAVHENGMDASGLLSRADAEMYIDKDDRKINRQSEIQISVIKHIGTLIAEHEINPHDIPAVLAALDRRQDS
ncbi:MAG TPA: GGDEF domain-containing protein [Candidatus Saccharimonadales bacterium]|nr:GGDEF domain-containing protein [Candidatus Saccharimonadales bacterium]